MRPGMLELGALDRKVGSRAVDRLAEARKVFEKEVFPAELRQIRERRKTVKVDTQAIDEYLGNEDREPELEAPQAVASSQPTGGGKFLAKAKKLGHEVRRMRKHLFLPGTDPTTAGGKCPSTDLGLTGLALSGGGVRSASFNVGILQVFAEHGLLKCVDYLSTVSGGGYIGCTLSTMLNSPRINLGKEFPILHKWGEQEAGVFRHLRNGANYLHPGETLEKLRFPSLLFVGMVSNLLLLAPYILIAAALTFLPHPGHHESYYDEMQKLLRGDVGGHWGMSQWAWAAVLACVLFFPRTQHAKFWSALASGIARLGHWYRTIRSRPAADPRRSRLLGRSLYERFFGLLFLIACAVTFVEAQPYLIGLLQGKNNSADPWFWSFAVLAGAVVLLLLIVSATFARASSPAAGRAALWGFGLLGPVVLWLLYAGLCIWRPFKVQNVSAWFERLEAWQPSSLFGTPIDELGELVLGVVVKWGNFTESGLFLTAALLSFLVGKSLVDVNDSSLNSVYRNRLSRGFLFYVDDEGRAVQDLPADKLPPADEIRLSQLNQPGSSTPYHLINATLNVQRSEVPTARNRKADFFFFAKEYCGGPLTSYCKTRHLEKIDPGLDLGTAMAVSGAAASANMGSGTVRALVFILALLNVRLGYWLVNPSLVRERGKLPRWRLQRWSKPKVGPRHFLRELFGFLDALGKNVYLSDGGHLENLGVFELLRRRCRFVIVSDAEADPELRFGGLARLIRMARVDLGCNIDIDLDDVRKTDGTSGRHCVLGRIDYGKGEIGQLLYIKLSVTGDEAETIREYGAANPAFPHEPTTDQFFTEAQFEAYRHLGWHIAKRLVERATRQRGSTARVDSSEEFFKRLEASLHKNVDRPDRELDLHRELSAIEARFASLGLGGYSFDVYPELGMAAERPEADRSSETQRQILHLCNQQLLLMERIFLTCHLDDPLRRKSSGNQSWLALFRRWARVPPFKQCWAINMGRHGAAFRRFCREELELKAEVKFQQNDGSESWTAYLGVESGNGLDVWYPVGLLEREPDDDHEGTARFRLAIDNRYSRRTFIAWLRAEAAKQCNLEVASARAERLDLFERHKLH